MLQVNLDPIKLVICTWFGQELFLSITSMLISPLLYNGGILLQCKLTGITGLPFCVQVLETKPPALTSIDQKQ